MAELLPAAEWTQREDLAQLVATLGADNIRWVGGAVRDTLLRQRVKDVDAATKLVPEDVVDRLKAGGIKSVPTGLDHGTITAVLPEGNVEITTLRKDVSTDGRRATVAFASDWRDDAARRDFTINALYAHPETREISDYFGGMEDLSDRRIRFIGDARERIREDHLRILRYFRFQARFGAALDHGVIDACRELAGTLEELSRERVTNEILSLLSLPNPYETVDLMSDLDVWEVVLPETGPKDFDRLRMLIEAEQSAEVPPDAIRRLAALLPALPQIAEDVGTRLRLSRAQRSRLVCAAERNPRDAEKPRALAYRESMENAVDRLLLAGADIDALRDWAPPELPLKGGEIIAKGIEAGPRISQILSAVEDRWIEEEFPDRSRIEVILAEELA